MMSEMMVKEIVSEMLKDYLSDSKADDGYISRENLEFLVANKVDSRNIVDYTFTGTSAESFEHNLGRTPKGFMILNQTQAAYISGDMTTWDTKRIKLTSSVGSNKVRFLFL